MEQGFVLDHSHGAILQSLWVAGPVERSRWTGLRLKGREKVPIITWRCTRCGYLESYAQQT